MSKLIQLPKNIIVINQFTSNKFTITGNGFVSDANGSGDCDHVVHSNAGSSFDKTDVILHGRRYYRIGNINQPIKGKSIFNISCYPLTKVHSFAITMIGSHWKSPIFRDVMDLATVYLGHEDSIPIEDKRLLFLFRYPFVQGYQKLMEIIQTHPMYVDSYHPDNYYIILIFDVPAGYHEQYDKILDGQWSKLSDWFKKDVISYNGFIDGERGICYQRLYQVSSLREKLEKQWNVDLPENAELWSKPIFEDETYHDSMAIPDFDVNPSKIDNETF